jgi:hypothetical protein
METEACFILCGSSSQVDSHGAASICWRQSTIRNDWIQMTFLEKARATLTDSHFLIPLLVFCVGLGLLITIH